MNKVIKCAYCRSPFVSKRKDQICCSKECSASYHREKEKQKKKEEAALDKQLREGSSRKRSKPGTMSAVEIDAAARAAGMTYGQYVAKYGL